MASSTSSFAVGPSAPISSDNLYTFCFSNPFQNAPNTYAPDSVGKITPDHTFDGQPIPPHRPSLIHAGTGATLSWQRARADALRVARYIRAVVGEELPYDGKAGSRPIHSPRTTILLHIPNCMAFPLLMLGGAAALCTVTPISTMLMPRELANILAKARPQMLISTVGDGEEKLRSGLQILLDETEKDEGPKRAKEVKGWARELASCWDRGRKQKSQKGDNTPLGQQRVWTVNLDSHNGADYYGTSARGDGVSTLSDPRDWSHLLAPPIGHKHKGSIDTMQREAFQVRKLTEEEQTRRVVLLLWSSGTTGDSKGVLLSHRNIVASITGLWAACPNIAGTSRGPGETWVALAPWCHTYGLSTLLLPTFACGATLVLPASYQFDLPTYLRLVTKYRATTMHIAPPVAVTLRSTPLLDVNDPISAGIDLSSVRVMLSGGAPTPTEVIKAIYNRTGKVLQIGYGATECGSNMHSMAQELNKSNPASMEELGSVGGPLGNLQVIIQPLSGSSEEEKKEKMKAFTALCEMKSKAGECVPIKPSGQGEICLKGPHVMLGYYSGQGSDHPEGARDENLTRGALTSDGQYYRTGDEGVLDYRGRLWITGRIKELIKVKGFQVPPSELDALFAKHPDVQEAAASGIVEGDGGEQIVMYIVPRDQDIAVAHDKQQALTTHLADFVKSRAAHYKWPRYYVFSTSLIKNSTGKILRRDLHTITGTRHLSASRGNRASKL